MLTLCVRVLDAGFCVHGDELLRALPTLSHIPHKPPDPIYTFEISQIFRLTHTHTHKNIHCLAERACALLPNVHVRYFGIVGVVGRDARDRRRSSPWRHRCSRRRVALVLRLVLVRFEPRDIGGPRRTRAPVRSSVAVELSACVVCVVRPKQRAHTRGIAHSERAGDKPTHRDRVPSRRRRRRRRRRSAACS